MFSISTALIVANSGAFAYWIFGYVVPGICRKHRALKREEIERSKRLARKI